MPRHLNSMLKRARLPVFGAIGALVLMAAAATSPAGAGTRMTVIADQARIIPVSGRPSAIIIGNPIYADVTVRKGHIIVQGRQYGTTNVIILGEDGGQLANFQLTVVRAEGQNVTVYRAGTSHSYNCAPSCEGVLAVGDDKAFFNDLNAAIITKQGTSTGSAKLTGN